jgi:transcriptional regulator with XRE-family HTH domain
MVSVMVTPRIRRGAKLHLYIQEWMEHRGLTPPKLAARIGVERQTVNRWMKEQSRLRPDKIAAIARALDMEPEELNRPPSRPSLDAILKDASDDDVKEAAKMIEIFANRVRRVG